MTEFAGLKQAPRLSELHENDVLLMKREMDMMNREYRKHPDFVRRVGTLIEDNLRLRLLIKN